MKLASFIKAHKEGISTCVHTQPAVFCMRIPPSTEQWVLTYYLRTPVHVADLLGKQAKLCIHLK